MAEQPTGSGDWPGHRREEIEARRDRQRREIRRRRLLAGGALAAAAVAIAAVLLAGGAGGSHRRRLAEGARVGGAAAGSQAGAGKVRNATPQPDWRPHTGPVPILEYHVLGQAPAGAPYPELYVGRTDFSRQMDWLDEQGFEAVTLEQVERAWYHGGTLPPKPVVLSFELAAHTIHHLDLTELDAEQLREEVTGSRTILRREYGVPVDDFCYPSGRFDPTVIAAVEAAGYVGATTEIPGYADREHPYELDRLEILGSTGVSGLAADLR